MSKRDHLVKGYLTEREKQNVRSWCEETGETQSDMVRNAVLEYIDNDRTARVESQVRELNQKVDDVLAQLDSGDSHTHAANGASDALVNAREIIRRLQRNHEKVVNEDAVDRAIEDYAGFDDRTLKKYKNLFRKRGLLFQHPGERAIWTFETDVWGDWVIDYANLNGGKEAAEEVTDPYPARVASDLQSDKFAIEITKDQ